MPNVRTYIRLFSKQVPRPLFGAFSYLNGFYVIYTIPAPGFCWGLLRYFNYIATGVVGPDIKAIAPGLCSETPVIRGFCIFGLAFFAGRL